MDTLLALVDPWRIELIAVLSTSRTSAERRSLTRDVERGLLLRLRKGVYVERVAFEEMTPEQQHIVRMRSFAVASPEPVVFSHWSAAVLHGLPVLRDRLGTVHATTQRQGARGEQGVTGHVFGITDPEIVAFGPLRATGVARTVVDIAGATQLEEGVITADGALHAGVPREALEAAAALVGPRRAAQRIADTIAFADAGAESAAESRSRVTMMRNGIEPPVLQYRLVLHDGSEIFLDALFPTFMVGAEMDGAMKLLDPVIAPDARKALVLEKKREDEARSMLNGLARWGWVESGSVLLLRSVLARVGVRAGTPRATFADYCARALEGRARFLPRRPRWRP